MFTTKADRAIQMDSPSALWRSLRDPLPHHHHHGLGLILPASVPLVGILMFGNLLRECGVTERLNLAAQNEILNDHLPRPLRGSDDER
ncbi:hypothetical protein MASR2M17_00100 [Aminivibrio sp.]